MNRVGYRYQQTIAKPAELEGVGYITGASVRLRFAPAPPSTGVVFVRTDLPGKPSIKAVVHHVTGTSRRTTIGQPPVEVQLVEHVLAALSGLRIDNCYVELDAPEPPGLDGSAHGFVQVLRAAGGVLQSVRREIWTTDQPIQAMDGSASIALFPDAGQALRISYHLDHGRHSPIPVQRFSTTVTPETFLYKIATARTFLLREEAEALQRQGIGSRTTLRDLVVFDAQGPMQNQLRFADEPARHKVLDIIGDLSLLGQDLCGHLVAYRSGHALNVALARRLSQEILLSRSNDGKQAA